MDALFDAVLVRGVGYGRALAWAAAATFAVCALHFAVARATGRIAPRRDGTRLVPRGIAIATVGLALLLGATAAVGFLGHGELVHRALFVHVGAGGAFVVALALLVAVRGAANLPGPGRSRFGPLAKVGFWLFAVAGSVAGATMMVATLPWFGTLAMQRLFAVHRVAGLVTVAAAMLHVYGLLLGRFGGRAMVSPPRLRPSTSTP